MLKMLNLNDKNLHENPFKISEEDVAFWCTLSFNVIEEDEDDDIELGIM